MDPDLLAEEIVELAEDIRRGDRYDGDSEDLAEKILNMFEWLGRGGFDPDWLSLMSL